MKTLLSFLSISFLVLLFACNDEVEESFIENDTDLNISILITSRTESNVNKSVVDYAFSGSNAFSVSNIIQQKLFNTNIYDVNPRNGSFISFSKIPEDHGVTCLVFNWSYTSINNPINNFEESIDLLSLDYSINNDQFQINIDSELAQLVNRIDDQDGMIKFEISGTCCNYLNCIANLHIPITVISKIYSPRFELTF